jgi:hypothetical protein
MQALQDNLLSAAKSANRIVTEVADDLPNSSPGSSSVATPTPKSLNNGFKEFLASSATARSKATEMAVEDRQVPLESPIKNC